MREGERQVAPDINSIRRDHVARYEWARGQIPAGAPVLDVACGVGYGSYLLGNSAYPVLGFDKDWEAIQYARTHYAHRNVTYRVGSIADLPRDRRYHTAVCFEIIEHLADPAPLLRALHEFAGHLIASTPNEVIFPYRGYAYHSRHYTPEEFSELLNSTGWRVTAWFGQHGPHSEVEEDCMGRTMIATCETAMAPASDARQGTAPVSEVAAPKHVALLGLGPSVHTYLNVAKGLGARGKFADEVWGINALGDVFQCHRIFHMDDVRIQEIRATARPDSNIAAMLSWLKRHPGPIYTSFPHADYPGLVSYPLEEVVNSTGYGYFNSTAAYAVAFAIHLGVQRLSLFGCDYTYANAHHAERGRGCLEFWLGFAAARGIKLSVPKTTSLLDALEPDAKRYYGYDCVEIKRTHEAGHTRFTFTNRVELPTADEIEAEYDHERHPNSLVSGEDE